MLMPRVQYTNNFNSNMDLATSFQQQQHHINQLLTTAAGGTGVVGDVDAMHTPLAASTAAAASATSAQQRFDSRPERNLWRTEEILQMLSIMQKIGAIEMLNDKTVKSEKVFRNIEELMHHSGYRKKSHGQIWTKWKFLKSTYTTSKRNGTVPKMIPLDIYEILHKMLTEVGGECKKSKTSLDGDSSSGGHLVISGAEGNSRTDNRNGGDSEDENCFGMAHPIFGFRLGMVKQEPADTGYETIANNSNTSERDMHDEHNGSSPYSPTASIKLQTVIKQELGEPAFSSTPLPTLLPPPPPPPAPPLKDPSLTEAVFHKRPVRIAAQPPATLAPNPAVQGKVTQMQLPPLRIAPFAKEPAENALQLLSRPPPPLAMQTRAGRMNNMYNTSGTNSHTNKNNAGNNFMEIQPKAVPNPPPTQITKLPVRFPRDIAVHSRPAIPAPSVPRFKHGQGRKLPYSLRPERIVPELESSSSPPLLPHQFPVYPDGPSTSQQAFNAVTPTTPANRIPPINLKKRKRRLEIPWNGTSAKSAKSNKTTNMFAHNSTPHRYRLGDIHSTAERRSTFESSSAHPPQKRSSKEAPQPGMKSSQSPHTEQGQEHFESALKDLSMALRQMQREMLKDFFQKQMELARKEHEFQMQQDQLIMNAFTEQSQQFMKMSKMLLGKDVAKLFRNGDMKTAEESKKPTMKQSKLEPAPQHPGARYDGKNMFAPYEDETNDQQMDSDDENSYGSYDTTEPGDDFGADESDEESSEDEDTMADPIQLVSSELVEGN